MGSEEAHARHTPFGRRGTIASAGVAPQPPAPLRPPAGDAVALSLAVVLGATFGLHRLVDPDVFLQVAVGRAILAQPTSLGVSTFIDAYPSRPYVEDKWLASVAAALADAAGGSGGLMIYQVALCVLAAAAWYYMQRAWRTSPAVSLVGVSLVLFICNFRLEPRPDTMSHALLAVTIGLVVAPLSFRRLGWLTPLLLGLWVNLHGYFVNGLLVLLAATAAAALGDRTHLAARDTSPAVGVRGRLALFALGLAACVLHPQGWRALASPIEQILRLRHDPVLRAAIQEFQPSTGMLADLGPLRWTLLIASVAAAIVMARGATARPVLVRQLLAAAATLPWLLWPPPGLESLSYRGVFALLLMAMFEIPAAIRARRLLGPMLLIGFTILAIPMVRNLMLIPPVALILLGPAWTAAAGEAARRYPRRSGRFLALAGVLAIVVATGWLRLTDRLTAGVRAPIRTGWGIDSDRFPAAAADFVEHEQLPGPLLNDFDSGGYLLYRFHPRRRVFIAGNTSMYPASFFAYYRTHVTGPDVDPNELHERYGVRTVIICLASVAAGRLASTLAASPSWALVFLDRGGAIFLRVDDATRPLIARLRVDLAERVATLAAEDRSDPAVPIWLGGMRLVYPSFNLGMFLGAAGRPDLMLREATRVWDRSPSEEAAVRGGQAALRAGRLAEDLPRLEEALARYPASESLKDLVFLGLAFRVDILLGESALGPAERDLQRMLALKPDECGPYVGLAKAAVLAGAPDKARRLLADAKHRDGDGGCRRRAGMDPVLAPLLD